MAPATRRTATWQSLYVQRMSLSRLAGTSDSGKRTAAAPKHAMDISNDADDLLDHFETYLGSVESSFRAKNDGEFPFMVLAYPPKIRGLETV